jgi:hypothetical protein
LILAVVLSPAEMQQIFDDGQLPEAKSKSSVLSSQHFWLAARAKRRVQKLLTEFEIVAWPHQIYRRRLLVANVVRGEV